MHSQLLQRSDDVGRGSGAGRVRVQYDHGEAEIGANVQVRRAERDGREPDVRSRHRRHPHRTHGPVSERHH